MKPFVGIMTATGKIIILCVTTLSVSAMGDSLTVVECLPPLHRITVAAGSSQWTNVTCDGLRNDELTYWNVSLQGSGTAKLTCGSKSQSCHSTSPGIRMYRFTHIYFGLTVSRNWMWSGKGLITCYTKSNSSLSAFCNLSITGETVSIKECPSSQRSIYDNGNRNISFTCDGFFMDETAQWKLDPQVGSPLSLICHPPGQSCDTHPNLQLSRPNASTSVLTIVNNHRRWLDNGRVTCFLRSNASIFFRCNTTYVQTSATTPPVTEAPKTTTTPKTPSTLQVPSTSSPRGSSSVVTTTDRHKQELDSTPSDNKFPAAAVGGGIAAVVVVAVIVTVAALVFYKRHSNGADKSQQQDEVVPEGNVNSVATSEAVDEESERSQYSSLEMSEVGQRSLYTDLAHSNAALDTEHVQPSDYASLVTSDVGVMSTYSVLGQRGSGAPDAGSADYVNTPQPRV